MELLKVIQAADALCPNPFTTEEKLRWCHEVSAGIRREVKKVYRVIETAVTASGTPELPDEIAFEDIERAYLDGKPLEKSDFRSLLAVGCSNAAHSPKTLTLVYLTHPRPPRFINLTGTFDLGENFIRMDAPPFLPGDCMEWVSLPENGGEPDWSLANRCFVLDLVYDGLVVEDGSFTPQTAAPLAIRRVVDDQTEINEAPYDGMYVEYLLAKIALYQHDYTGYQAHMLQYNTLYDRLRRDYKTRAPIGGISRLHGYWNS